MRKEITISGKTFGTKKSLTAYMRELKKNVGTTYPEGSPEYIFIYELIVRGHPEPAKKLDAGISAFVVDIDKDNVTRFMIRRPGGGPLEDIAYTDCVDYLDRDKEEVRNLKRWSNLQGACRRAVKDQIDKFRRENRWVCALCAVDDPELKYPVDHFDPDFIELLVAFNQDRTDVPKVFVDAPLTDLYERKPPHLFREEDAAYASAFTRYHQTHAHLRMLCQPCNLGRTKKGGGKGPPPGAFGRK